MPVFGQILPTDAGTDLVAAVTDAISDNIAEVLVILGFMVGLSIVLKLFRRGLKGRV